jgi:hypothetical protein
MRHTLKDEPPVNRSAAGQSTLPSRGHPPGESRYQSREEWVKHLCAGSYLFLEVPLRAGRTFDASQDDYNVQFDIPIPWPSYQAMHRQLYYAMEKDRGRPGRESLLAPMGQLGSLRISAPSTNFDGRAHFNSQQKRKLDRQQFYLEF